MSTSSSGDPALPQGTEEAPRPEGGSIVRTLARWGSARNLLFLGLALVSLVIFWEPIRTVWEYSQHIGDHEYDKYSHTLLIPFITLGLMFWERQKIFARLRFAFPLGVALLVAGLAVDWSAAWALGDLGDEIVLSARMLGLVIFWAGAFTFCYGTQTSRAATFSLLFLLLTVPLPDVVLNLPVSAVRDGSTEICSLIFSIAGVPYLRDGFNYALPGVNIEVAKECSGIHSTLALFIVGILAGHLLLSGFWKKFVVILLILPVVCFTNGLRIAGLTLGSIYVSPNLLYGDLHHKGGVIFFLLGAVLLFGVIRLLQRGLFVRRPHSKSRLA